MSRPWWWYTLQASGAACLIVFMILAFIGVKAALFGQGAFPQIPLVNCLTVLGISGFGWVIGSSLGSWLDALRRKQRKWPTTNECLFLVISLPVLIPYFRLSPLLPWWAIVTPIISIIVYFLLWWLIPAKKKEECADAKSP